ncbi:hypothetical protein DICPUDRAFT_99196 [Dictyostelium purpureum]|uniref:F-box domain-containing protein n=1 Tax=Dictyostelium purpureum TaxID=5786 RepID=F0ZX27_DICPU|nr:uncharacterized protein DICPUDRAFT_99196 [Dictyostelium purpureum]EGC31499.1 hypothetical protein DICPUDRAFT_99196 [Dictyostelium purpureum]|eukprot:XP_003291974.1 hypothetical protein DICPUDRAFT_99196 [Dictyostelium purpureum]
MLKKLKNNLNYNIDLATIDSLIDNNIIDNLINSDPHSFSSFTDDYIDYHDVIIDLDFGDSIITTSNLIITNSSSGNGRIDSLGSNSIHSHNHSNSGVCSSSSSESLDWKCSSVFVTYNIKTTTGECSKDVLSQVQKRISTFKGSMKIEQLDLSLKEFNFNTDTDFISTVLSKEIQYKIMSYLSIYDILSMFQVNKYWYELSLNNNFWKSLLKKDLEKWSNREAIKLSIKNLESRSLQHDISWKKYYANIQRLRLCKKCGIVYRESSNCLTSCCYHADIRDIVHSRGVPSGVYWICCLSKPKQAPGCTMSCHEEENQIDYPSPLLIRQ